MENYKNLASVIRSVVTEAHNKDHDSGWMKKAPQGNVKDKSGAIHTPMSRAKDLARKAMQQKMKESFDLDITDEEADDLLESIQEVREIKEESEWMRTMHFTADDHEREAAKHLKDADAHKKSGNMPEHYAAMINHYTSKAKAHEKRTPLRGTGPS